MWRGNRIYLGRMARLADDKLLTLRRRRRVDNLINQVENELVVSYLINFTVILGDLIYKYINRSHRSDF